MSRMDRKKEDTQNKIINVSVELFNRHGLEAVTMEQIAEAADIAKGTLYNYFPFKEAIINAFLQRSFRERSADRFAQIHSLPDTRSRLVHVFALLIEGVQRQKEIFEAFMVYRMKLMTSFHPVEPESRSGLGMLIGEIVELGQQNHELRADFPGELMVNLFEFALITAIRPFYLDPEHFDQQKAVEQSVDLFLNGARGTTHQSEHSRN